MNSAMSLKISYTDTETLQIYEPVTQFWEVAKQNCSYLLASSVGEQIEKPMLPVTVIM